jgi:hypothetical protein
MKQYNVADYKAYLVERFPMLNYVYRARTARRNDMKKAIGKDLDKNLISDEVAAQIIEWVGEI